jgi:hypothetical protein
MSTVRADFGLFRDLTVESEGSDLQVCCLRTCVKSLIPDGQNELGIAEGQGTCKVNGAGSP